MTPRKSRKSKERILEQTKVVQTDPFTGEQFVSHHVTKARLPTEPPFVKLYIDDLSRLLDIKDAPKNLLLTLITKLDYEGYISITPFDRQRIAERLGITKQTFANYLQKLMKADIIKNVGRGSFQVNPRMFAKGDWSQILQQREAYTAGLELRLTYEGDTRRITAVPRSDQPRLPFDEVTVFESEQQQKQHYKEEPGADPRRRFREAGSPLESYREEIAERLHRQLEAATP